jgi:UDP-N-acetylglucosamine--N-acetylmuramyl-(pentapeptide) pyrophosphoryl-undecaprenol N-acetylglucosamine transferase
VFSDVVPPALALLPADLRARLAVTQQCRAEDLDRVRAACAQAGIAANLAPFFADIAALLRDTHLVIARAGASTIAELATIGRPAILVPLPGAIDDHQSANAASLAATGGAWAMPQPGFTPEALAARLAALLNTPPDLATAAAAVATAGRAQAASDLADLVQSTIAITQESRA